MQLNEKVVTGAPIPAASVILLRDAPGGFEVFLVQRHSKSTSFGGAHVFPGGKVDKEDHDDAAVGRLAAPRDAMHRALGETALDATQAAALHFAACRETFEECGVLLAGRQGRADAGLQAEALAAHREGASFADVIEQMDLSVDVSGMSPWSRWITPVMPSLSTKRFDTRFFVVALPGEQTALHDNREAMDSLWVDPRQGLDRYWANEMQLAPPQIMTLAHLSRFKSVPDVLADAGRRAPPLIQPEPMQVDGLRVVAYPGDPGHPLRERAMPGPSRLVFRNGHFEPNDGYDAFFA